MGICYCLPVQILQFIKFMVRLLILLFFKANILYGFQLLEYKIVNRLQAQNKFALVICFFVISDLHLKLGPIFCYLCFMDLNWIDPCNLNISSVIYCAAFASNLSTNELSWSHLIINCTGLHLLYS